MSGSGALTENSESLTDQNGSQSLWGMTDLSSPAKYTILLVDDESFLLEIGKIYLEKDPRFSIHIARSAREALEKLQCQSYDAIVSDYQMPDMNGIEFLRTVRRGDKSVPFILFSGKDRGEFILQALSEGVDSCIQKTGKPSVQFAELGHAIGKAIRQNRMETRFRDLERRERDLLDFLPDPTFVVDIRGKVIAWNRPMEHLTGISSSEILNKGDRIYALPFYQEQRSMLIDLVFDDDPNTASQYPFIVRDGEKLFSEITIPNFRNGKGASFWIASSPLHNSEGKIIGAIELIREVSNRKMVDRKAGH